MINHKTEIADEFEAELRGVEIALNDNSIPDVFFELPPVSELQAIKSLYSFKVSVDEEVQNDTFNLKEIHRERYEKLKASYDWKRDSYTYLNRLANYCSLIGEEADATRYLEESLKASDGNPYVKHKLSLNYLRHNSYEDVEKMANDSDLDSDVEANLRLAYIHIKRYEVEKAEENIEKALSIDATHYMARVFHGAVMLLKGEFERAVRSFRVALQENNSSSSLHVNLAVGYAALNEYKKAKRVLSNAILLNPFNENAVLFYADISNYFGHNADAIPAIKSYLQYNQKSYVSWEKLARAYYLTSDYNGALHALRHQASIDSTPSVRNNIGLVNWKKGNYKSAVGYFNHALQDSEIDSETLIIAASNFSGLLIEMKKFKESKIFIDSFLSQHDTASFNKKFIDSLGLNYVISLEGGGDYELATEFAEKLLSSGVHTAEVRAWLYLHLIVYHAAISPNEEKAQYYSQEVLKLLKESTRNLPEILVQRSLNNVMFSALTFNDIEKAKSVMIKLNKYVHHDPYVTATFGLYKIKKGNLEDGAKLYNEAVSLVSDKHDKNRIRQRMNFEIGNQMLSMGLDKSLATKYISKAIKEKVKHNYIKDRALRLIRDD